MIELAATGQTVVRLKSGDPVIFGRLAKNVPRWNKPRFRMKLSRV